MNSILDLSKQEVFSNVLVEIKLYHKTGSLHPFSSHLCLCLWWKEGEKKLPPRISISISYLFKWFLTFL